jgi:hypothetical protein
MAGAREGRPGEILVSPKPAATALRRSAAAAWSTS